MKTERQDTLMDLLTEAFAPINARLDKLESDYHNCSSELRVSLKELQKEQREIKEEQRLQNEKLDAIETKIATAQKQLSANSWDLREITETQMKLDGSIETLALRSLSYETELRKMKRIKLSEKE